MVRRELIEKLRCTACRANNLRVGGGRRPTLECADCDTTFPIIDDIPDMIPPHEVARAGHYRTDTLHEVIAGVYDVAQPMMSLAIWHCSPLRYVDVEHRAIGRANPDAADAPPGTYVRAPMGTGAVLDRVLAPYHNVRVIGVDSSWKMLRKAQRRFRNEPRVALVRGRLDALPLRDDVADSLHSANGLHTVTDRIAAVTEFERVTSPDGFISGSALIRGQELVADAVLDRYEQWGVLPMMRTAEFLVREMHSGGLSDVRFETHGAVLFFNGLSERS